MTAGSRTYGGVSADDRRRGRRDLLVAAVLDVVGERGVSGVTVDGLCAAAGLTKRYFYESFSNLDAALVAALDGAFVELRDRMIAAVGPWHTPAERARAVVEVLVDTLAADPRLTRLYVEASGHAALRARRDTAVGDFTALLLSEPMMIWNRDAGGDRRALAVRLVVAGTTDLVVSWLSGAVRADRDAIIDTIVAAGLVDGLVDG